MRRIFITLQHTITGRVVTHVALFSIVAMLIIFTVFLHMEKNKLEAGAARYTLAEMEAIAFHIDDELHSVEVTMSNHTWRLASRLDNPDSLYSAVSSIVEDNSLIHACTIAFVPDYYPSKGRYYAPCAVREGSSIVPKNLNEYEYEYEYLNWFIVPKLTKSPYWGDPKKEYHGGKEADGSAMNVVTYSCPMYDPEGKLYAVVAVEVSLHSIAKIVSDMRIFPSSFNVLLDRRGMHIAHPDSALVLHEAFFAEAYGHSDEALQTMKDDMAAGRSGYILNKWNGDDYYLTYRSLKKTGWTLLSVCPAKEVIVGVERYALWASVLAVVFVILVVLVCQLSVRFVVHPVENITAAMRRVAHGRYDNELVAYNRVDEIAQLRNAFAYMQKAIASQSDRMRRDIVAEEEVRTDMRLASAMRQDILQASSSMEPGESRVDIGASIQPAKISAGDMYQHLVADGRLYFMMMGVSARGTLAASLMSIACRIFRSEAMRTDKPEVLADIINRALSECNPDFVFCPAFIGVLNLASGRVSYCNAGHPAPVMLTAHSEASLLEVERNMPLGASSATVYAAQSVVMQKGSALCLYSDGVTDAVNADMSMYGEKRLMEALKAHGDKTSAELADFVMADVQTFAAQTDQLDDRAAMIVRLV